MPDADSNTVPTVNRNIAEYVRDAVPFRVRAYRQGASGAGSGVSTTLRGVRGER